MTDLPARSLPHSQSALLRAVLHGLAPPLVTAGVTVSLFAQSVWAFRRTDLMLEYSDEIHHVPQIQAFCAGDYTLGSAITMLPGYHLLSAWAGRAVDDCSLHVLRGFNVVCGLLVTFVAYQILSALRSRCALARTCAFYYLPILFPYHFVAYSDVSALLFALAAVWAMQRQCWTLAGVVGSLGVLVRQTTVVVLGFMLWTTWLERDRSAKPLSVLRWYVRRCWSCLIGLAAFGGFVLWNHGVAIGDRGAHRPGLHVGNLYFSLFLLAIVSLPVGAGTLWKRRRSWFAPALGLTLLAACAIYVRGFEVAHPYNAHMSFLRNVLLQQVGHNPSLRALFFLPIAFGLAVVWFTRFSRTAFWTWIPISIATLLPEALIEQRYAILPIALWQLLRRDAEPRLELLAAVSNAALSLVLLHVIAEGTWQL